MVKIHPDSQIELSRDEFNTLYEGGSLPDVGMHAPIWVTDQPQPAVIEWQRAGLITSPVLDAGCGTGANAIFLAQQGHKVTGFDFAASAINLARANAHKADLQTSALEFLVADATDLTIPGSYTTIVDSALYHGLDPDQRHAYVAGLARLSTPHTQLLIACISDQHAPAPGPFRISEANLYETLTAHGWTITSLTTGHYETQWTPELMDDTVTAGGLAPLTPDEIALTADKRVKVPVWLVQARQLS